MKNEIDLAAAMEKLRWLRLPGMTRALESLVARARKDTLTPLEIVDALCEEEKNSRIKSAVERRPDLEPAREEPGLGGYGADTTPAPRAHLAAP